jgi:hypothetical protein
MIMTSTPSSSSTERPSLEMKRQWQYSVGFLLATISLTQFYFLPKLRSSYIPRKEKVIYALNLVNFLNNIGNDANAKKYNLSFVKK